MKKWKAKLEFDIEVEAETLEEAREKVEYIKARLVTHMHANGATLDAA